MRKLMLLVLVLCVAGSASAAVVIEHVGSTDPLTEGWTADMSAAGSGGTDTEDYWNITTGRYLSALDAAATAGDWTMSVRAKVISSEDPDGWACSTSLGDSVDGSYWSILLTETGMGYGLEIDMIRLAHEIDLFTRPMRSTRTRARRWPKQEPMSSWRTWVSPPKATSARRRR